MKAYQVMNIFACIRLSAITFLSVRVDTSAFTRPYGIRVPISTLYSANTNESDDLPLEGLNAAIVGSGPSGLLVAHYLLQAGATVQMLESRSNDLGTLDERAYALGIGMRGRTAIRGVDENLWDAVKSKGYESERFTLYIGGFPFKLRDGTKDDTLEPSVLMYQSDLCAAMLDELTSRFDSRKFSIQFGQNISTCDFEKKTISSEEQNFGPFDLVVGCDGVNSAVRNSIKSTTRMFQVEKSDLPGLFKVCRLGIAPQKVDPTSVALILPKAGTVTAFVEPTAEGSCILFAGGRSSGDVQDDPILYPASNLTATVEALEQRFPLLEGCDFEDLASQLATQKGGSASSVKCNAYHYGNVAAIVGDAAHATGGVSGQGVNSALADSKVLACCLIDNFDSTQKGSSLGKALLQYSKRQVPEGLALYDLSFGPKPKRIRLKLRYLLKNAVSTIFRGRFGIGVPPLQTLLTTTLKPFAEIRHDLAPFYDEEFPSQEEFDIKLSTLYENKS